LILEKLRVAVTKMLGKLVQREMDDLPVLTLARGDEKSAPYPARNRRAQVRKKCQRMLSTAAGILNKAYQEESG